MRGVQDSGCGCTMYYSVKVHKHGAAFKQRFIKHFQASGRYGTGASTQIFFHFSQQFHPPSFRKVVFHAKAESGFWRFLLTIVYIT